MSEKLLTELSTRRVSPARALKRFRPREIEILSKRGIQAFPVGRKGLELVGERAIRRPPQNLAQRRRSVREQV
jgi:hypothetical protein